MDRLVQYITIGLVDLENFLRPELDFQVRKLGIFAPAKPFNPLCRTDNSIKAQELTGTYTVNPVEPQPAIVLEFYMHTDTVGV